ncbi:hypothetical protein [Vibrio sp. MEBiC08052]|uniref:hypothetical protein n=1 Tax=Vibrio sp. MEBiC08052 TaxID=1761910 RepID=UPI0007407428|nr:hypothetical protein [Vibrio sp. MEBiC08052]KUJ00845.1 hypothetical protein VRK_03470 [Vibrio sp. MEBiC08052]
MLSPQERAAIKQDIQSNQHEIYVISFEEMDNIVKYSPHAYSKTVKDTWKKLRDRAGDGANWYSTADDGLTLVKLISDLGGIGTKAYIKTYGGKPHIILKGNPRLRTVLTGTKYGVKNAKVVTMGLGKAAAISGAKAGGVLSVILMSAYRIADYVLTDEITLSRLIGSLATDVVKIGIVTGASIVAAYGAGLLSFAIGPLAAVVIIGFVGNIALTYIDNHYHITDRVVEVLDEMGNGVNNYLARAKHQFEDTMARAAGSVIDYVLESAQQMIIDFTKHSIDRFLSPQPKVYF